jgi:small subunit ribosomal protein S2
MKHLTDVPDAIFVIDTRKEAIAVTEANKKGVAVVALLDTNCDPDEVQYGIPSNDDAIRAGILMARIISDAVDEGHQLYERYGASGRMRRHDIEAELARQQAIYDAASYEEQRAREEAEEAARLEQAERAAVAVEAVPSEAVSTEAGESEADVAEVAAEAEADEAPAAEETQLPEAAAETPETTEEQA